MEGSPGEEEQGQERALRAMQVAAISGFVEHNLRLQESCMTLCNLCREYVPLRCFLRICWDGPATLLAAVNLLCVEADGNSRVLLPKRALKVYWTFDDPGTYDSSPGLAMLAGGELVTLTPCDIDMSKVRWPEGVEEVHLSLFNRRVDKVVWPDSLKLLAFCWPYHDVTDCEMLDNFNKPLNGVTFPAGLREIWLGPQFDQRIDGVAWPEGLELLSMPGFNYPISGVRWPPGLKTLYFLGSQQVKCRQSSEPSANARHYLPERVGFDQRLVKFLPMSLETLWLSDDFDQSLVGVIWPSKLAVLALGTKISGSFDEVEWPASLRTLILMDKYDMETIDVHPDCEIVFVQLRPGWSDY